jgi:hypothetical protein
MSEREHAHQLVDRLPEPQLLALVEFLEKPPQPLRATAKENG